MDGMDDGWMDELVDGLIDRSVHTYWSMFRSLCDYVHWRQWFKCIKLHLSLTYMTIEIMITWQSKSIHFLSTCTQDEVWYMACAIPSAMFNQLYPDDVIKWKHFARYWPFVRGIHRPSVNSPNKGQWRGALMLSLICAWINGWISNRRAGDSSLHRAHYDVTVMLRCVNGFLC